MKGPYLNPFCVMQKYNSGVDAFRGSLGGIHDRSSNPHHFGIQQHWRNRRCTPVSWSLVTFSPSWIVSNVSIILNHHIPSHDTMTPWHYDPRNHWFHFGTLQLSGCPKLPLLFIGWTPGRGSGSSHDLTKIYVYIIAIVLLKKNTHKKSSNHAHFSLERRLEQVADSALRPPDIQNGDRDNDVKPSSQLPIPPSRTVLEHLKASCTNSWKSFKWSNTQVNIW